MAKKMSESGNVRRRELTKLRKLSPDVSDKFISEKEDVPFGKAIGESVKWRIIGDMADRTRDFDLNFILLQIAACQLISSTAKALIPFENNKARRSWLKDIEKEYKLLRGEYKEIILLYVRGEGAESEPRAK